jgi:hypothetical protein
VGLENMPRNRETADCAYSVKVCFVMSLFVLGNRQVRAA